MGAHIFISCDPSIGEQKKDRTFGQNARSGQAHRWWRFTFLAFGITVRLVVRASRLATALIDTIKPTRAELFDSLWSIEEQAIRLSETLKAPMTTGYLSSYTAEKLDPFINDGLIFLSELTVYARQARNSLIQPNGKLQPGAGKPHLPGQLQAKYICAAIVARGLDVFSHWKGSGSFKSKSTSRCCPILEIMA